MVRGNKNVFAFLGKGSNSMPDIPWLFWFFFFTFLFVKVISTHRKLRKCRKAKRKVKIFTLSLKVITVVCAKVLPLCLCSPTYYSQPGSDHAILQTRIRAWVAVSYSRGSSQPRDRTLSLLHLLCWRVSSLPLASPGKSEPLLLFRFIPLNTYLVHF